MHDGGLKRHWRFDVPKFKVRDVQILRAAYVALLPFYRLQPRALIPERTVQPGAGTKTACRPSVVLGFQACTILGTPGIVDFSVLQK
jgi:hypothetical protein